VLARALQNTSSKFISLSYNRKIIDINYVILFAE
jgi:hypothetical protein